MRIRLFALVFLLALAANTLHAQTTPVIIDTDVGDDVDDAFAIALVLASPELKVLGITSAWGDTQLRARMIDRMLCETGRDDIAVNAGIPTKSTTLFTQAPWARAGIDRPHKDGVAFLLDQAKAHPGEITLLAIGPLTNIGAAIDRDPVTFRKLKRVVLMGGSIRMGYGPAGTPPEPEYNIARDPASAQKLLRSGVPLYFLPLDSTQIMFDNAKKAELASISTPMTDALQILVAEWMRGTKKAEETLFDAVAAAYTFDNASCPMTPLHLEIDDKGMTIPGSGTPNASACLTARPEAFFNILMPRLLNQRLVGNKACLAQPAK
ncbi:MAG: nucleoside hydrolase [Acidobacteria bacterium]|nr:nucleoside hydrolase [Acidobacteriota bacterium]